MASEIFDSLPYYDDDLQKYPGLKEKVQEELARELKESQTLHPRVPPAVELFAVREQLTSIYFASDFNHAYRIILY
jgi:pre-mRNA-splicing factor SPF27